MSMDIWWIIVACIITTLVTIGFTLWIIDTHKMIKKYKKEGQQRDRYHAWELLMTDPDIKSAYKELDKLYPGSKEVAR